jgi:hypothetical protein
MALPKALEDLERVAQHAIDNLKRADQDSKSPDAEETRKSLRGLAEKLNKAASDVAGG